MITLGVTGGIGSGKSFVSNLLKERGVPVFDCDSQAKRLTVEDESIRRDLVALLGSDVYTAEGLNKPLMASYLFASKDNASRINGIIHPRVRQALREWFLKQSAAGVEIAAMESAILFESGFATEVDRVLMVQAPVEIRCARVIARDHTTLDQVKRRIDSQLSDAEKSQRVDYIIENDGVKSLPEQLDYLFSQLKAIKGYK